MDTNNNDTNNNTIIYGEKHQIIEGITSVIEEEDVAHFEEPIIIINNNRVTPSNLVALKLNAESNGFSKELNGDGIVEYPLPESNGGDDNETEIETVASSFSKNPETAVGLKYVESLLDESSNGVNGTVLDLCNADNTVSKTVIVSGQSEIVEAGGSKEVELEADEYEVERVIHNQESHDLICPYCKHDITKRVILQRKRKIEEISGGEEELRIKPGPTAPNVSGEDLDIDERTIGNKTSQDKGSRDGCIDAISCFSCFSIFIPKGDGFLWWRFEPKPDVTSQTVPKLDSKPPLLKSEDDTHTSELSRSQSSIIPDTEPELPTSIEPVEEFPSPPTPKNLVPVTPTPNKDKDYPLWIVTCCQPSEDRTRPEHAPKPGENVPFSENDPPTILSDDKPADPTHRPISLEPGLLTPSSQRESPLPPSKDKQPSHMQPSIAVDHAGTKFSSKTSISTKPSAETPVLLPHETQPVVTPMGGINFPFWLVTCCQPSSDNNKAKLATMQEETVLSDEFKTQPSSEGRTKIQKHDEISPTAQSDGTAIQHHDTEPTSMQSSDMPVPSTPEPPITSEPWESEIILPKPLPPIKPGDDTPSPPDAPPTPPKDEASVLPVLQEQSIPQSSDTPPDTFEMGPTPDIEQPILPRSREPARAGVSELDILKAIVYGGLLECIASLSVITSAAGGDATTLNIVALGLANVCGGFVVLLHNLRTLKHEHTTERYTEQLGRPGHFLLHAIVAILSYLTFGLMSPIIYGFAFRKSDNKDYKLTTLASASLFCIVILSIGKAYVQRPPKTYFQTVSYYICMGFMVSGVGYVAGDLINMFLKKLDVFDSREAPAAMSGAWATY